MPAEVNPHACEAMVMVCIKCWANFGIATQVKKNTHFELNHAPIIINSFRHSATEPADACT